VRVFLDTNVLASGLTTRGLCAELVETLLRYHSPVLCKSLLDELAGVLAAKFGLPAELISEYRALLMANGELVPEAPALPGIPDPDDVPLIAAAHAARTDIFITGDKALLKLGHVEDMAIVSPRQAWEQLKPTA
jgi:putative PIN family toxin of toxin-antitoxin system